MGFLNKASKENKRTFKKNVSQLSLRTGINSYISLGKEQIKQNVHKDGTFFIIQCEPE